MKKIICLSFISLSVSVFGQKQEQDTAQVVIKDRINSPETLDKPYVILVSSDGYRYDYTEKYNAQNLKNMANKGVQAVSMYPSYPSITFPNHWSIITGLYPSHHGIVDNFFYDYHKNLPYRMSKKEDAENGMWYGGTPLWALAEQQGVLSASLQWVGSASDAAGTRPTYYYHYFDDFSPSEKVDKVVSWLKLPAEKRPHFITLYFPETDGVGHFYGPNSEKTGEAVQLVDKAMGELFQKVKALNLKNVNIIFVSDHGMIGVDVEKPIIIPEFLEDKTRFDVFNSQTLVRIKVKNENELKPVYRQLKRERTSDYKVYLAKRFPNRLHYGKKDDRYERVGDIFLLPNAPKIFVEKNDNPKRVKLGKHGYDPKKTPEMRATFYAIGDQFKTHYKINSFENVNVYPLIANILGLKITSSIDGDMRVLEETLKK